MSFTAAELAALRLADLAEDGRKPGGRPRTLADTPYNERKRFRARARACGIEIDHRQGGRPRKPLADPKTEKRREQKRLYYYRRKGIL